MRIASRPPWIDDRMQYFVRADERENQAAFDGKRIEPNRGRVVRAGVYKDCIGGAGIERASIAMDHFNLGKMGEIAGSTRSQLSVDLEGAHLAARTNHVREDRRVVPGAASDMRSLRLRSSASNHIAKPLGWPLFRNRSGRMPTSTSS
jgi:hypothetical protein